MPPPADPTWAVVVPVKRSAPAKTRLAGGYEPWRAALAQAFAADTIDAVCACDQVAAVYVVTDATEPTVRAPGGPVLSLVEDPSGGRDLNIALTAGVRAADCLDRVAVVAADLPALRADELGEALAAAAAHPSACIGDLEGIGTTLLTAVRPARIRPAYGGASYLRHVVAGAVALESSRWPTLRRDVDVAEHLAQVRALGPGPRTADLLRRIAALTA